MTNLNASMANNSALSNAECKYDYETITKSRYTGANNQCDVTGKGLIQDKISLVGNRFDDFGDGFCHLYKKSNCNKKESLKMTDFICRNNKNDDIIEDNVVDCMSTQIVQEKEKVCHNTSLRLGDGQNMVNCQSTNGDFGLISSVGEQLGDARRSDAEKLTPEQQMNLLIQAENAKLSNNFDENLQKRVEKILGITENLPNNAQNLPNADGNILNIRGNLPSDTQTPQENARNIQKNTDSNTDENIIAFHSVLAENRAVAEGKPSPDLDNLIKSCGGEAVVNARLERAKASAVEKLKTQSFVAESVGEDIAIKSDDFDYSSLIDNAKVEAIFNALKKPYKCDLLNMDFHRSGAKNWPIENWVKFFLKSVKMATFTVKYYDRMFDRQVRSSFYSEHIARFGSIENFFDELTDLMARKQKMLELRAFIKRLYKELSEVEILIVDKLVFGVDNMDEIRKHISLRTVYRKADKIVPKLVEFMQARGYSPEWCYENFGELLR